MVLFKKRRQRMGDVGDQESNQDGKENTRPGKKNSTGKDDASDDQ